MSTQSIPVSRGDSLNKLASQQFDVLIIGGGVTGAGIALDAAARGLLVALVEMQDFAAGTSSRSTKLIHGGLRYLKNLEFGIVREVGLERNIVYNNAHHIVRSEKMLLPLVKGGSLGKYSSSLGLWMYDRLAGVKKHERRKMLSKEQTLEKEPLLDKADVVGGGEYVEYRSDDARLVIELIKSATTFGACSVNYCKFDSFLYDKESDKVCGGTIQDLINDEVIEVKAKTIVNAAGPWVDTLREEDGHIMSKKKLQLSKGVHLVVAHERLPLKQSIYFDVEADDRMVFAIPRGRSTYIGTTDTIFTDPSLADPSITDEDISYVLAAANAAFPTVNLTPADVESGWSGLRPLIFEPGKDSTEISRKDEIFVSSSGLISIAGGKLTGYRQMARRTVNQVSKQLGLNLRYCPTEHIQLSGGRFNSLEDVKLYINKQQGEASQVLIPELEMKRLVFTYGSNTEQIVNLCYQFYQEETDPILRLHKAEIEYLINHEHCITLSDVMIRRTGMLYFDVPRMNELLEPYASIMGNLLDWDEAEQYRQIASCLKNLDWVPSRKRKAAP